MEVNIILIMVISLSHNLPDLLEDFVARPLDQGGWYWDNETPAVEIEDEGHNMEHENGEHGLEAEIDANLEEEKRVCETCGKGFSRIADLKRHERFAKPHRKAKEFQCVCSEQFSRLDSLRVTPLFKAFSNNFIEA